MTYRGLYTAIASPSATFAVAEICGGTACLAAGFVAQSGYQAPKFAEVLESAASALEAAPGNSFVERRFNAVDMFVCFLRVEISNLSLRRLPVVEKDEPPLDLLAVKEAQARANSLRLTYLELAQSTGLCLT